MRGRGVGFGLGAVLAVVLVVASAARPRTQDAARPAFWTALEELAAAQGVDDELEIVLEDLRGMTDQRRVPGRHAEVLAALRDPALVPGQVAALREDLLAPVEERSLAVLWPRLSRWTDPGEELPRAVQDSLAALDEVWAEIEDESLGEVDLLERLGVYLAMAQDVLESSLDEMPPADRERLLSGHADASEEWYRSHFPQGPADGRPVPEGSLEKFRRVLLTVDGDVVREVGVRVARLLEPAFVDGLGKRLARTARVRERTEGFEGDVLRVVGATEESRVVLGGKGRATYSAPAALIVDLGGDDTYTRAAVVDGEGPRVQLVIDLAGDDLYQGAGAGPVYAVAGVAMLLDRKGNDRYHGTRHAESCTAGGFTVLIDEEGDDEYLAEDFGQAYSLTGCALLYDLAGDDRYDAWSYVQGAGNGSGFSALCDVAGDDSYVADGHWPDVYGDSGPDIHHGAAQGFSLGFRDGEAQMAGGFAVLLDEAGKDRYQAGNFSQGGGYFFGYGVMIDGGGDDENEGSRYAQGFGVHQAVGVRWDRGGNDRYHTRSVAHLGSAWDEGVGYLLEDEGDDVYDAGGLALGAAAQTAFAVLLDAGGDDQYRCGGGADTLGGAGGSEYHQKPSLGVLLDLGGGHDQYSRADRKDDTVATGASAGLFLDARKGEWREVVAERTQRPKPGRRAKDQRVP